MRRHSSIPKSLALIAIVWTTIALESAHADSTTTTNAISAALRDLPLDRLSSGALLRLDRDGNLVRFPVADSPVVKSRKRSTDPTLNAGLDARVGSNLRLGEDPAALPASFHAQAEPHIVRNPYAPDTLAATFQEGRYTDGGAVNCGYAISHDGGLSWTRGLIPSLAVSSGGPYYRATDPVVGIGPQGHMYFNNLVAGDTNFGIGVVTVSRSTNGGVSFEPPVEVYRPSSSSVFPDKNWMVVNTFPQTTNAGRIVVTWTMFTSNPKPIVRSYSDDGGRTWKPQSAITPTSYTCQGSQPVFLPDGSLAVVYWNFASSLVGSNAIEVATSADGGKTFDALRLVTPVTFYDAPGIRDGYFLPSATVDRTNGVLFVTYQARYQGAPRVMFTKSANKGVTWTAPKPVSDNPTNAPVFNPAISASPDGQTVTIIFHDGRVNSGDTNLTDLFLAQSFDGGNTWQPNLRVTSTSSDVRLAPLTSGGYMLGDYLGIAPPDGADVPAVPVWVDTRTGNPDPFIARVGIAPGITFTSWRAARFSLAQIADPTVGAPGANPDGDAYSNVFEYAFGLQPLAEDTVAFSFGLSDSGAGDVFHTLYERLSNTSDLTYSWLASTNLADWIKTTPTSENLTTNASRLTEMVTSTFASTNANQFYQLTVELQ